MHHGRRYVVEVGVGLIGYCLLVQVALAGPLEILLPLRDCRRFSNPDGRTGDVVGRRREGGTGHTRVAFARRADLDRRHPAVPVAAAGKRAELHKRPAASVADVVVAVAPCDTIRDNRHLRDMRASPSPHCPIW